MKGVLILLGIKFDPRHAWGEKEFSAIAAQIQKERVVERLNEQSLGHIRLPRLLLLANFWGQFYLTAKYGFEAGYLAPASDLFGKEEADLALLHAEECFLAAVQLRYLDEDRMAALVSPEDG